MFGVNDLSHAKSVPKSILFCGGSCSGSGGHAIVILRDANDAVRFGRDSTSSSATGDKGRSFAERNDGYGLGFEVLIGKAGAVEDLAQSFVEGQNAACTARVVIADDFGPIDELDVSFLGKLLQGRTQGLRAYLGVLPDRCSGRIRR